jgi:low affinity Fe/Cu permease
MFRAMLGDLFRRPIIALATWGGHPVWIWCEALFCFGWFILGYDYTVLTFALSVLALTLGRAIMFKQDSDREQQASYDRALHTKLDAIINALPGVSNALERAEELDIEEIDRLRERHT